MKNTESSVFLLKNRLDKINQLAGQESVPVQAYNTINRIVPPDAHVLAFGMSSDDKITIAIETSDTETLDLLFNSLLDPKVNEGYFSSVKLDNIRLQQDLIYVEITLGYIQNPAKT